MLWHELSWPQIEKIDKQKPVVVPLGSTEQHGLHLPVFVDTIQVTAIAKAAQEQLNDRALFTPALWLGSSHHHLDFPGTLSISPSLYSEVIKDMTRSILKAGFKRIFFLNGHGGNQTPIAQALSELVATDDTADAANLATASWWQVGAQAMDGKKQGMDSPALSHACEYETSVTLFLRPDLVHLEKAIDEPDWVSNNWVELSTKPGGRVSVFHRFARMTEPGSLGLPSAASSAKGEKIFNGVVDQIVSFINDFSQWPLAPVRKNKPKKEN